MQSYSFPNRQGRMSLSALSRGPGYRRYASADACDAAILEKRAGDAAMYEKQNESACAAAPVLSEAPGAFLHFHLSSPFSTSSTHAYPLCPSGPRTATTPRCAPSTYIPPRLAIALLLALFLHILHQARLQHFCLLQPLSSVSAIAVCFFAF